MLPLRLIFSPLVIVLEINISVAVTLFPIPLFSRAVSLLLSFSPHIFFFLLCFVSSLPSSASSNAPESFCVFGVILELSGFQPLVSLTLCSDNRHKTSHGLFTFKALTCQSALSLTLKHTTACCRPEK